MRAMRFLPRSFPRSCPRWCRRAALLLSMVLVAAFAFGDVAGADDVSPITPANRPTGLSGAVNGQVPVTRLVNVAPNCMTAREAGPSLARIFAMAREINDSLGAEQCYRPL